jgi:hypothetical protein
MTFLLVINVFLVIVGCVMEGYSATLVVVPLITPIAYEYGIDPYHLGVIFLLNLEIAYALPPVGFNLFLAALKFGRPVISLYRVTVEFVVVMTIALLIVTYVPALSLGFFERPSIELDATELFVTQGEDRLIEAKLKHGSTSLETARIEVTRSQDALAEEERTRNLSWDALQAKRKALETALQTQTTDAVTGGRELQKLNDAVKPFAGVASRVAAARKMVLVLEALAQNVEWRSREAKTVLAHGPRLSTKGLTPGRHTLTATTTGDRGHTAQAIVSVLVKGPSGNK